MCFCAILSKSCSSGSPASTATAAILVVFLPAVSGSFATAVSVVVFTADDADVEKVQTHSTKWVSAGPGQGLQFRPQQSAWLL